MGGGWPGANFSWDGAGPISLRGQGFRGGRGAAGLPKKREGWWEFARTQVCGGGWGQNRGGDPGDGGTIRCSLFRVRLGGGPQTRAQGGLKFTVRGILISKRGQPGGGEITGQGGTSGHMRSFRVEAPKWPEERGENPGEGRVADGGSKSGGQPFQKTQNKKKKHRNQGNGAFLGWKAYPLPKGHREKPTAWTGPADRGGGGARSGHPMGSGDRPGRGAQTPRW